MSQKFTTANQTPELTDLTIEDIQSGLKTGAFTSTELVESFQDRIDKLEPTYNAFTSLNPDALARAKQLDQEYQESGPRSPLHGVPIVVKDTIDVAGLPTTAGYEGFVSSAGGVDLTPETNASIIDKLEDAGAIILGKTNLPAFSSGNGSANTSYFGPTYNGYDPTLAPGASSTGSATAVAADMGVVGISADSGGSITIPAAAQSLVGIKPTFGLVSGEGSIGLPSTVDVLGPLTNNVYDAAATLDVIAGEKPSSDSYVSALDDQALKGKRIGLFGAGFEDVELTPETQTLYDQATQVLIDQGATVVEDPFAGSGFTDLPFDSGDALKGKTSIYDLDQYLKRPGSSTNVNSVDELIEQGVFDEETIELYKSSPGGEESLANPDVMPPIDDFLEIREAYLNVFSEVMESNDLDALVFPQLSAPVPDFSSSEDQEFSKIGSPEINIMGTPGVTVPAGNYADGSPFSLSFLGESYSEADLLSFAYDYEQATV
jgi:amidase